MKEEVIRCSNCGWAVSTPVPPGTIVRAYVECPNCTDEKNNVQEASSLRKIVSFCLGVVTGLILLVVFAVIVSWVF